jgi:hypothetical protein
MIHFILQGERYSMPVPFELLVNYQDKRVRMCFEDGIEVIATFHSATRDMDGSTHLIYEKTEWSNDPKVYATAQDKVLYAADESLRAIEEV